MAYKRELTFFTDVFDFPGEWGMALATWGAIEPVGVTGEFLAAVRAGFGFSALVVWDFVFHGGGG